MQDYDICGKYLNSKKLKVWFGKNRQIYNISWFQRRKLFSLFESRFYQVVYTPVMHTPIVLQNEETDNKLLCPLCQTPFTSYQESVFDVVSDYIIVRCPNPDCQQSFLIPKQRVKNKISS